MSGVDFPGLDFFLLVFDGVASTLIVLELDGAGVDLLFFLVSDSDGAAFLLVVDGVASTLNMLNVELDGAGVDLLFFWFSDSDGAAFREVVTRRMNSRLVFTILANAFSSSRPEIMASSKRMHQFIG
jgi:hypothetical protein